MIISTILYSQEKGVKTMSKRAENEKKLKPKSLKLSADMLEVIKRKAKDKNMNFSQFMIDCALHNENCITPEVLCKIENIIELCTLHCENETVIDTIRKEADELWDFLN